MSWVSRLPQELARLVARLRVQRSEARGQKSETRSQKSAAGS
jgi:hypothetical protein